MTNTDKAWEQFGRTDPYHGVLTKTAFEKDKFDEVARAEFFQSGEDYIDYVLEIVSRTLDSAFVPTRALDFGCGVGRLTLPLARRADEAVGVDISSGMLEQARRNALEFDVNNVIFVESDDRMSKVEGTFDLVHSFIVLQHIFPNRGLKILRRMIGLVEPDGVGIVHLTYANAAHTPLRRRLMTTTYERVPFAYAARNGAKGRPLRTPQMHMNRYHLSHVFRMLQETGCHDLHVRFTEANHYNYPIYGIIVLFKKSTLDTLRFS